MTPAQDPVYDDEELVTPYQAATVNEEALKAYVAGQLQIGAINEAEVDAILARYGY